MWARNALKQSALAMHNRLDQLEAFPPVQIGPGLSWRVKLLPYLGETKLYQEFHRDEPWDSRHNQTLLEVSHARGLCPGGRRRRAVHDPSGRCSSVPGQPLRRGDVARPISPTA